MTVKIRSESAGKLNLNKMENGRLSVKQSIKVMNKALFSGPNIIGKDFSDEKYPIQNEKYFAWKEIGDLPQYINITYFDGNDYKRGVQFLPYMFEYKLHKVIQNTEILFWYSEDGENNDFLLYHLTVNRCDYKGIVQEISEKCALGLNVFCEEDETYRIIVTIGEPDEVRFDVKRKLQEDYERFHYCPSGKPLVKTVVHFCEELGRQTFSQISKFAKMLWKTLFPIWVPRIAVGLVLILIGWFLFSNPLKKHQTYIDNPPEPSIPSIIEKTEPEMIEKRETYFAYEQINFDQSIPDVQTKKNTDEGLKSALITSIKTDLSKDDDKNKKGAKNGKESNKESVSNKAPASEQILYEAIFERKLILESQFPIESFAKTHTALQE